MIKKQDKNGTDLRAFIGEYAVRKSPSMVI